MKLSRAILPQLHGNSFPNHCFDLPEKVLQFGTGVLLRGLPDALIDKANKAGHFNGRIVVVKSTDNGNTDAFKEQDYLYTQCIRGIQSEKEVSENVINKAISRVLHAGVQWEEVLACATLPQLQLVISNTTEAGIVYVPESIHQRPPDSFPAKLLAFLYHRYLHFKGDPEKGLVIIPTELIPDNGALLKEILLRLCAHNKLDAGFITWLQHSNDCCNSLVDRIVPGAAGNLAAYEDALSIMTEVYGLWAIETDSERVKAVLSFRKAAAEVVVLPDIRACRELKLRLLNGTHTLSCGLALLAGMDTVSAAMRHPAMAAYIAALMTEEITPAITDKDIREDTALHFAAQVLDRFRNPYIAHRWSSISSQYTAKLRTRVLPLLQPYIDRTGRPPVLISLGFAAYLLWMRQGNKVDEYSGWYQELWQQHSPEEAALTALRNQTLWGQDLTHIPGFASAVIEQLNALLTAGVVTHLSKNRYA